MYDFQLKAQWAEQHFKNFQIELRRFTNSHPYSIVIESDPQTQETLYRLKEDFVVPPHLRLIAGDILQHLRSTLDYFASTLVRANGNEPTTHTSFPISDNVPLTPKDEESFSRKIKGVREDAVSLIRKIEPYKAGDYALWRLHRLNNIDKHRLLVTCGTFVHNWSITQHIDATNPDLRELERMARAYAAPDAGLRMKQATFALKAGDVIFCDFPHAKPNKDIKFFIEVAVNEPGVCELEPLSAVLYESIMAVRKTIHRFMGMY
jgi:hypothetical protein